MSFVFIFLPSFPFPSRLRLSLTPFPIFPSLSFLLASVLWPHSTPHYTGILHHSITHSAVMLPWASCVLLLLVSTVHVHYVAGKPPNFVFLMADDFGYGDVAYNGGAAETPNLDLMATGPHSLKLTRYYSGGPVCSPTRGTLLTGRNHNRYCIWTANAGNNCNDFDCPEGMPLPTSEITVAEILQKQGYRTAAFGKWHLGDLKPLDGGNKKWPVSRPDMNGFDDWWVTERSAPTTDLNCACFNSSLCPLGHYTDPPPCTDYYTRDSELGVLEGLTHPVNGDDSHFLASLVSEFLDSVAERDEPSFLYVPFHTVHIRYIASMGYIERYRNFSQKEIDYYGAITAMDAAVGEIRELLNKHGVLNNTMLWFVSDNGPVQGSPGRTDGFRGWKRELYEGGIRVPGIIEWPEMIKENRVSDYAVVASDFLPTVCDILNISPPTDRPIDGTSILPLIHNEKSTRNQTISWAYSIANGDFNSSYHAAISGDQYKVFATYHKGQISDAELYDLMYDPSESTDISEKHPETFEHYKQLLEAWRESVYKSAQTVGCLGVSQSLHCPCNER